MRQKVSHVKGGAGPHAKFVNKVSRNKLHDSYPFIHINGITVFRVRN